VAKPKTSGSILVVDDDRAHRTMLRTLLGGWGYSVEEADDGARAIERVHEKPYDLVLMDVRMVEMSGLEALPEIKRFNPAIPVIIMTAYSSVETAVEALKKGAYDYLTKPLDFDELRLALERAMDHGRLKEENRALKESLGVGFNTGDIIGRSRAMVELLETVAMVAPTEATVLITGESGTGKELIAGAIHFNSPRRESHFIKVNCAAITETLLESELFGHEKGAFTGADRRKEGRFKLAHGGSIFLDEISETSVAMQAKLVVTLPVPALRQRSEDIPLLAQHFLETFAEKNRKPIKGFTPQAMDRMMRYDWPGNVRELMNAVERSVILCRGEYISEVDFPLSVLDATAQDQEIIKGEEMPVDLPLEEVEKVTILNTLESAGGNKSETARRLGITRRTLHKKLKKYGVM